MANRVVVLRSDAIDGEERCSVACVVVQRSSCRRF